MNKTYAVPALVALLVFAAAPAHAGPGIDGYVECAKDSVRELVEGTPWMCSPEKSSADVENPVTDCVRAAAKAIVEGYTPEPCALGMESSNPVTECVRAFAKAVVEGYTPEPCALYSTQAGSPVVDCVKRAVRDYVNGVTPMPCDL